MKNKLVIITGASSGIGKAISFALARKGMSVILLARTASLLNEITDEINASGGQAYFYSVNLAKASEIKIVSDKIKGEIGIPDVIINNAGLGKWRAIDEISDEEAIEMISVPYLASVMITRNFIKEMIGRGSGHIINITSPVGFIPIAGASSYGVARWAMNAFSKFLKADLYNTGINVSLIVPGKVNSAYFKNNPGSEERIPTISKIFRTLQPEEVAEKVSRVVDEGRGNVYIPFLVGIVIYFHRIFPGLVNKIVILTGWKRTQK